MPLFRVFRVFRGLDVTVASWAGCTAMPLFRVFRVFRGLDGTVASWAPFRRRGMRPLLKRAPRPYTTLTRAGLRGGISG